MRPHLVVISYGLKGFGDFLFGIKCARLLKNHFPDSPITFLTNDAALVARMVDFPLDIRSAPHGEIPCDLAIQVPAFNSEFGRYRTSSHYIALQEYGQIGEKGDYTTGFSRDSLGLFFEEPLPTDNKGYYFGYSHCPFNSVYYRFVRCIVEKERAQTRDIHCHLIGNLDTLRYILSKNHLEKSLILHELNFMPHREMRQMLYESEDFVCVTGDQSLSEAISANKSFLYEMLTHKKPSFRQLQVLAKNSPLAPFFERCAVPVDDLTIMPALNQGILPLSWSQFPYKEMAHLLNSARFQQQRNQFYADLKKEFNFNKNFISLVRDKLASFCVG